MALGAAVAAVLAAGPARAGDDAGAVNVEKAWKRHCQSCHGADGKGDTKAGKKAGARDLTDPEVRAKFDRDRIVKSIREGIKEEDSDKMAMKAYSEKLSEAEIEALADHSMKFE